ncbi:ABC transporter transmembrane domain-containing protein [Candidatus Spongiihabitans sp.]|uniref:ABC transporter transmembrane domain-containing protein n=1 Tax=Candidatus Spongiihabitans sp. TaxID=3101308 RepID=UPI003C79822C
MNSSLLRLVWQHSSRQQLVIVAFTCLSFPLLYLTLEIPKIIINRTLSGGNEILRLAGFSLEPVHFLLVLCVGLLALIVINGLLKMKINTLKGITGERLVRRLRFQLIDRLLRFPLPHFSRTSQGELISTLTAETEPLAGYISESIALPLFQGGTMLTILFFLFMQDWVFGLASVALIPVQGYVIPKLQQQVNTLKKERVVRIRKLSERIGETISGAEEIRLQGTRRYILAEFSHWLGGLFQIRLQIFKKKFFMKFLNNTIGQITPFLFYLFGGILVIRGELTIGALVAALAAYKDLTSPWKELLNHYQAHEDAKIKYQQIIEQFSPKGLLAQELLEHRDQVADGNDQSLNKTLTLSNVSWANDTGEKVITAINLEVAAGSWIAIVGQNAMQRLRLAQLLTGLEKPVSGRIDIGDIELDRIAPRVLHTRLAYQGPDPYIFSGTATDNVLYGMNQSPPTNDNPDPVQREWITESIASGNSTDVFFSNWLDYRLINADNHEQLLDWFFFGARAIGTDSIMYQRGLLEIFNPPDHPQLTDNILEARKRIRSTLRERKLERVVAEFNLDTYNRNATVAENILFGVPRDEDLRGRNLAAHPILQQTLEKLDILELAIGIGGKASLRLAERIQKLPKGHNLLNQFDLESDQEIAALTDIAERLSGDGIELSEDERADLLGIFLHLIPELHAFGFIHERVAGKLLQVRHEFFLNLPQDLKGKIIRFDMSAYHPKLTIIDNLLFGRVVAREPAAERKIAEIVEHTLEQMNIKRAIMLLFAQSEVGISGSRLPVVAKHRISVGRMLMKKPDIMIFHDALAPFDVQEKRALRRNIHELLPQSTTIWIDREIDHAREFDRIYTLADNGSLIDGLSDGLSDASDAKPVPMEGLGDVNILLGQSRLFGSLEARTQQLLAEHSRRMTTDAGEFVYRRGQTSKNVYLIIKGNAHSLRDADDPQAIAGNLVAGEGFGLMDLLALRPRAMSVVAVTDLELLRIDGEIIQEIIEDNSAVMQTLLRAVTEQWSSISR